MRTGLCCGILGLLLMAACGSQPSAAQHRAYIVVQHLHGAWLERRVDFGGSEISGVAAMDRSGFEYKTAGGKAACQVDNEPATYSECVPQNKPYWALFVATAGKWASAAGIGEVTLHDGDAIGWHYVWANEVAPPPVPAQI